MPKRLRLTRRFPVAMTEDGYLFENFGSVIDEDKMTARLRLFNAELDDRKR